MLSLGKKYGVQAQVNEAIYQLGQVYPETISDWDSPYCQFEILEYSDAARIPIAKFTKSLASTHPHLHYRALYDCCQLLPHELVYGVPSVHDPGAEPERLSNEDLVLCLQAQHRLYHSNADLLKYTSAIPDEDDMAEIGCITRDMCLSAHEALHQEIMANPLEHVLNPHPLETGFWIKQLMDGLEGVTMCDMCLNWHLDRHTKARHDILADLPNIFARYD